MFYKCFPFFKMDAADVVEGGEGHGPRKEFFDLAAAEMLREWEPAVNADGAVVTVKDGSEYAYVVPTAPTGLFGWDTGFSVLGSQLVISGPSENTLTACVVESAMQKLVLPFPCDMH